MLSNLDPFQQLILGVTAIALIMIILVIFLTGSPDYKNTDRLNKIIKFVEDNNKSTPSK